MKRLIILVIFTIMLVGCADEPLVIEHGELVIDTITNTYNYKTDIGEIITGNIDINSDNELRYEDILGILKLRETQEDYLSLDYIKSQGYFVDYKEPTLRIIKSLPGEKYALGYKILKTDTIELRPEFLIETEEVPEVSRYYTYETEGYSTILTFVSQEAGSLEIDKFYTTSKQTMFIQLKETPKESTTSLTKLTVKIDRTMNGRVTVQTPTNKEFIYIHNIGGYQ